MDPMTWVYLALLAASTTASYMGQKKTARAQGRVMEEDRQRRAVREKATQAAADATANEYAQTNAKEAARAAELAQVRQQQPSAAPTQTSGGAKFLDTGVPYGSTKQVDAISRAREQARTESNDKYARQSKVGAFGDVMANSGRSAARNDQSIGLENNLYGGWQSNVLPALLANANTAGKEWSTTADILKLASAVMSFGALSGAGNATNAAANSQAGVLDQMGGVPKTFAGKDLFGTGSMGSFNPLSVREATSIGDAANLVKGMDMAEFGLPANYFNMSSDLVQPSAEELQRYWQNMDPFGMMKPSQRRHMPLPIQF